MFLMNNNLTILQMLNLILNEIGTRHHAKTVFHVKPLWPGLVVDTRYKK
jgi:hypothetical protein